MSEVLVQVRNLRKVFRQGFWMRKVEAVKGVSFEVRRGDIFGFLGPNGAGKTTTIKMLTGLIAASGGEASIFGEPVPSVSALRRIGFLPENPYIYPYLTPTEFVEMCGRLSGLRGSRLVDRARTVLERCGILYAADRPVQRLSKGMLQRTGLAAALVADPELLILDEPMSGLDPVGRKEVRDLIVEERAQGRTIFFSTHILSDVETLCDEVTILRKGKVVVAGKLRELLHSDVQRTDIVVENMADSLQEMLRAEGHAVRQIGTRRVVEAEGRESVPRLLQQLLDQSCYIIEVNPRHETLEDLFVREAIG